MTREQTLTALEAIRARLDESQLDPDPERADWSRSRDTMRALRAEAEALGRGLAKSRLELDEPAQRDEIAQAVATVLA